MSPLSSIENHVFISVCNMYVYVFHVCLLSPFSNEEKRRKKERKIKRKKRKITNLDGGEEIWEMVRRPSSSQPPNLMEGALSECGSMCLAAWLPPF